MTVSLQRLKQSFFDAARGFGYTFRSEQNFRIQMAVAILVGGGAFVLGLKRWEIILVFLLILMVLSMELLNTVVEKFSDLLMPRMHQQILVVKDVMAAAVLATALGAGIIGGFIFWPYLVNLLK